MVNDTLLTAQPEYHGQFWNMVRTKMENQDYLNKGYNLSNGTCAHVHDEVIIECKEDTSLEAICEQMGRVPKWAEGLVLRADGYCTPFYKKD